MKVRSNQGFSWLWFSNWFKWSALTHLWLPDGFPRWMWSKAGLLTRRAITLESAIVWALLDDQSSVGAFRILFLLIYYAFSNSSYRALLWGLKKQNPLGVYSLQKIFCCFIDMICCSRHGLTDLFYKESDSKYFQDLLTILTVVGQYTVATTQLYQCSVKDTKRFMIHKGV